MVREYSGLYCDTAVVASMFRWRVLPQMLENPLVIDRTIHGSDFPFPLNAMVFWNQLWPNQFIILVSEKNLSQRGYLLKRALGLPDSSFHRGASLL